MKPTLLIAIAFAICFASCAEKDNSNEESFHEIPIDEAYEPFVGSMMAAKSMVQQVLFKALQMPELNGFTSEEGVVFRTDCPEITDHNPDVFPKRISFDFGTGCTTLNGVYAEGVIDVWVSDKLDVENMTLDFIPNNSFRLQENRISLVGQNPKFILKYEGLSPEDYKLYDMDIQGMQLINNENYTSVVQAISEGVIAFDDVNTNNESLGLIGLADDEAHLDFAHMAITNRRNENLSVVMESEILVDLFCECPMAGSLHILDDRGRNQYVNFDGNADCGGQILVDRELRDCR